MSDWHPVEFPWTAVAGDYARITGGRYIVMTTTEYFETYQDLECYVEKMLNTPDGRSAS